jgi:hypothetical protein
MLRTDSCKSCLAGMQTTQFVRVPCMVCRTRNLQSHRIDRTPRIRWNDVDMQLEIDTLYSSVEKAD